jgi:hypothetical protein
MNRSRHAGKREDEERLVMRAMQISSPTIKEIAPTAWLITCQNDVPSSETIEDIQDACLNALDRGALIVAVDLNRMVAIPSKAIEVFAITSEMLAARGGCLWLVWPQLDDHGSYRVLSFDEISRRELERMIGTTDERSPTPSGRRASRR